MRIVPALRGLDMTCFNGGPISNTIVLAENIGAGESFELPLTPTTFTLQHGLLDSIVGQHSLIDVSGNFVLQHVFVQFRAVTIASLPGADVIANVPIEIAVSLKF